MTVAIPDHHKAMIYDDPGNISVSLTTVKTPKPKAGQVLINLTHSGVCYSDLELMTNGWLHLSETKKGTVSGHEGVGNIVEFGPGSEACGLTLGDRVGVKWLASICGLCMPCLSGLDASCAKSTVSSIDAPGTFQQYIVSPVDYVTSIPASLPSELAAPLLCGGLTVYAALKKCGAQPGQTVVIPGAGGGLGHLAVQIGSRGMGYRVIGLDTGEKEQFVKSMGAEVFLDITKYSPDEADKEKLAANVKKNTLHGLGAAAVIVCTGSKAAYNQALSFLGFWGTIVCVGMPQGKLAPIADAIPVSLIVGEKKIVGSAVGNRKDAIEVMEMAARGIIETRVTVEPMSKLAETFQKMERRQLQGRVVVVLSLVD